MNGNPDTAADITQDVFLKLLENIQSVRKIGKFQNYLLTIAVNTCNNYTKKAKPLYMDLETLEDIEDTDNEIERLVGVIKWACFQKLWEPIARGS